MFVARQLPLLVIFLMVALTSPELAAAELPVAEAPVAAATESVAVEAAPAVPAATPDEAAPPAAEPTPPPSPPAEAPPSLPQGTVEHTTAAVESAVQTSLPPEPQQHLTEATQEAQEGLGEVADQAAGEGEAALQAAAHVARETVQRPLAATRPVRDMVSTALGSANDTLPQVGPIEPTFSKPSPSDAGGSAELPLLTSPGTEAATPTRPSLTPEPTLQTPPAPIVGAPAPFGEESRSGHLAPIDVSPAGGGHHRLVTSISAPRADSPSTPGDPSPAPSLPGVFPPNAFDAVTTAPGGGGTGSLLALLALALLLAPSFASKPRMNVGNCRPAPFASLLERPG
jgi:hypothetical protein